MSFVVSALPLGPPHRTTRLPMSQFLSSFIMGGFTKTCQENLNLVKTKQKVTGSLHEDLPTFKTTFVTDPTMVAFNSDL
jgi:hypothetical protein